MRWQNIGYFKLPQDMPDWWKTHAQLPTALPLGNSVVRVFFAARSAQQVPSIAFADLLFDKDDSFTLIDVSTAPILLPGELGFFDEHGVYPSCVIPFQGKFYLYYVGWNRGYEAPLFYASVGLAISDDGLNFQRHSNSPLLARSVFDPCFVSSPHIHLLDSDNWLMSYISGVKWTRNAAGNLQSHYHIKLARSGNPFDWKRSGDVAIDFNPGETNIARSAVIELENGVYGMWFSYVHSHIGKYRMGYAESNDGLIWKRKDQMAGIDIGGDLAKDMICYPCVFRLNNEIYMLYNGDNRGAGGFGVAKLSHES